MIEHRHISSCNTSNNSKTAVKRIKQHGKRADACRLPSTGQIIGIVSSLATRTKTSSSEHWDTEQSSTKPSFEIKAIDLAACLSWAGSILLTWIKKANFNSPFSVEIIQRIEEQAENAGGWRISPCYGGVLEVSETSTLLPAAQ